MDPEYRSPQTVNRPDPSRPMPVIADGFFCARCGYDLTTLAEDAICPECALPVSVSLRVPAPEWADLGWVTRFRNSCAAMLLAQSVTLASFSLLILPLGLQPEKVKWGLAAALLIDGLTAAMLVWPARGLERDSTLGLRRIGVYVTCWMPLASLIPNLWPLIGAWPVCVYFCFAYIARAGQRARMESIRQPAKFASIVLPLAMLTTSPFAIAFLRDSSTSTFQAAGLACVGVLTAIPWAVACAALVAAIVSTSRHIRKISKE